MVYFLSYILNKREDQLPSSRQNESIDARIMINPTPVIETTSSEYLREPNATTESVVDCMELYMISVIPRVLQ